jgi:hypothetical protein
MRSCVDLSTLPLQAKKIIKNPEKEAVIIEKSTARSTMA